MRVAVEDDALVDFIRDGEHVPALAQLRDHLQLVAREHLAGGIVRRVDHDGARAVAERALQFVGIEAPIGFAQPHVFRFGAGEDRIRAVVLVERLEDDHLVSGIDTRQHHGHHRFGGPAADRDLLVGVHRHAVAAREVRGDGVPQRMGAVRRRILILFGLDRRAGGVLDHLRRLEIREALREIDRVMEFGQAGHFAEHRIGERRHAPGATDLRHEPS